MRRVIAAVAIVLTMNVVAVTHAGAASTSPFNRALSGPFTGTSVFTVAPSCHFSHQAFDATYLSAHGRSGSFDINGCVQFGALTFAFTGEFRLTTPNRALLEGTVSGTIHQESGLCSPPLIAAGLDFTLVVTQGTKQFRHRSGTIQLAGTWCSPARPDVPGPISGVLSGHLP